MQMCWEVAKDVWRQHKYRSATKEPISRPVRPSQSAAPVVVHPPIDDVIGQARDLGCNLVAGLEHTNAMDSGNYSNEWIVDRAVP